jgi:copper chaperone CopZ
MEDNTATVVIGGMHSQDCVRKVAEALLGVEGVDDVVVDFENRRAVVTLNPSAPADEQHLAESVREEGYGVERIDMPMAHPPFA